jgi:hypothetical protein
MMIAATRHPESASFVRCAIARGAKSSLIDFYDLIRSRRGAAHADTMGS